MIARVVLAAAALAGCTERVQLGHDPLAGLVALAITPSTTTLSIDDLAAAPQRVTYTATGTFGDGSMRDVTDEVDWTVDNPNPGHFVAASTYETSQAAAGHVTVQATSHDVAATAALTVIVDLTLVDSTSPPPIGADAIFASGTPVIAGDPMHAPAVLYPSDATRFPQGLARILVQYTTGTGNDAIRIRFDSDVLHLAVLTGADRWQPDATVWSLIEASHPGTQLQLVVDGVHVAAPNAIYASAPATLGFSRGDPGGVVYYWSAAANDVVRGSLGSLAAARFYPPAGDATCVGCHAISRDGAHVALGYGGETLQTFATATGATEIDAAQKIPMGWATFSPDGTRVLVADKGVLTLRDARTGAPLGSPDGRVHLMPMQKATHPDWSPDGKFAVIALSTDVPSNMDVKTAAIARLPYMMGHFGMPEILVPVGPGMENNYFPKYSPDGKYIAYVHATEPAHGAKTAELRIIPAAGGPPIVLRRASLAGLSSTMPAWGPIEGTTAWLAFATIRPYGAILPTADHAQIWITGLDLAREGDPSFAAFWLPCQDSRVMNNNAVWSMTTVTPEIGNHQGRSAL
jgi:TolB protein